MRHLPTPPARECPVPMSGSLRVLSVLLAGFAALQAPTVLLASAVLLPAGDAALRDDLNRLADRGLISLSLTNWPLPREAVNVALKRIDAGQLNDIDAAAYARVQAALERTDASAPTLRAAGKTDDYRLPRGFQSEARGRSEFGLGASLSSDRAALSLAVQRIDRLTPDDPDEDFTLDGSYASLRLFGQIAAFGQIDRWWGPADQGSAILGSAARPFPALSLQRATQTAPSHPWLSWIGPWTYQLVFGQLLDYEAVPHTKLVGMRLSFKPFDRIDIGASRSMQWGGRGRMEDWDSFWDAFIGESNTEAADESDDPANQLGGFDLRVNPFGPRLPLAFYAEYIGEDETEANHWPAKIIGTLGAEWRFNLGDTSLLWRAEHSDTTADGYVGRDKPGITYLNGAYPDGYYQHGLALGYPIGGDGELSTTSLIATDRRGIRYELRLLRAEVNPGAQTQNLAYPEPDTLKAGIFRLSLPIVRKARLDAVAALQDSERFGVDPVMSLNLNIDLSK